MAEGETFKATVIGRLQDGTAVCFDFGYVDLTSGTGHIDTGTAAGDFQTLVQAKLAAVLPDIFTFQRYRFACVGGAAKGEIGYVDVSPIVNGSLLGDGHLPNEIAISVKRSTGHSSRSDRGRIFLGPVAQGLLDADHLNSPDLTNSDLLAVKDLLKANLITGTRTLRPVILNAAGTYSGRTVSMTSIGSIFVHRRTRRPRSGA